MRKKSSLSISLLLLILLIMLFFGCASTSVNPVPEPQSLTFRDAIGKEHDFFLNKDASYHSYDCSKFSREGQDKLLYDDDEFDVRHGLDISRHDGKIDWKKVKGEGYDFVILRVGYRGYQTGKLKVDENFHSNIKGAAAAGFDIGVYVFSQAINKEEAIEEAELVLNEIKDYEISLPVVYDPESIGWDVARTDGIHPSIFNENTVTFCERIREAGYEPMIYANHYWEAFVLDMSMLKKYKFWYADYENSPQLPYDFEFWQYTAFMSVPGIKKKCDADIWIRRRMEVPVECDHEIAPNR